MKFFTLLLLGFTLLTTNFSFGQTQNDSVQIIKKGGTRHFIYQGERIMRRQFIEMTKTNSEAYLELKRAYNNKIGAGFLGFSGGLIVAGSAGIYLIYSAWITEGKPFLLSGLAGVGLMVGSVALKTKAFKQEQNAVAIYNEGLNLGTKVSPELRLGFNSTGLGLSITF